MLLIGVCIHDPKGLRNKVAMLKEQLKSVFTFSIPTNVHFLFLVSDKTVAKVMRARQIDAFNYFVRMGKPADHYDLISKYSMYVQLTPNVLLQNDSMQLTNLKGIRSEVVYEGGSGAITMCKPFKSMFQKSAERDHELLAKLVTDVRDKRECHKESIFLLFRGPSHQRAFVRNYMNDLMADVCKRFS
jgi:hypothetical protein